MAKTFQPAQDVMNAMTVLVVDDSAALRGALRAVLGALGCFRVAEADNASAAIEILGAGAVDLVITDWKMAPLDGIALVTALRTGMAGPNADLPVLMLSAYDDSERRAAAYRAGVSLFLPKPFTAASLAEALAALGGARSADRAARATCEARPQDDASRAADHA